VKPLPIVVLVVSAVAALAAAAQAAVPTHLTVNAPASVGLGEEIILEARLATADGQPVAGARLELRQVGTQDTARLRYFAEQGLTPGVLLSVGLKHSLLTLLPPLGCATALVKPATV